MAQKAKKDRARANIESLKQLHIGTLTLNGLFILFNLIVKRRSLLAYLIFSIPCFVAQYILETTGRPKYDANHNLKSAGEDLAAVGLTEYMFDVIWITWLSLIAVITFGNWGWLVWSVVPVYGAYKGYGLIGLGRSLMGGAQSGQMPEEQVAMAGNRKQRRAA